MSAKISWLSSPNSIKHVCIFKSYTDYYNTWSHYSRMPHYLINECEIKLVSFINLPQSSLIYIGSFTIFIAIHVAHLNTVYDKAKFCTGGWGKPILIYHMIDRLSIIVNFNDRQKVKDNIWLFYQSLLWFKSVQKRCLEAFIQTKLAKGWLKSFENKTQEKKFFCILRFCPTFSMLEV